MSEIIVLNESNYEKEYKKNEYIFLMVYAHWDGYSKVVYPEFKKASQILKGIGNFAILNFYNHPNVSIPYAGGYPTLVLLKNGELHQEYQGERKYKEFVKWYKENTGLTQENDDLIELNNDSFEEELKDNDFIIVLFYSSWGHSNEYEEEIKKLSKKQNVKIAKIDFFRFNRSKVNIKQFPTIIFFKHGKEISYFNQASQEIEDWYQKSRLLGINQEENQFEFNKLIELNQTNYLEEFKKHEFLFIFFSKSDELSKIYEKEFRKATLSGLKFAMITIRFSRITELFPLFRFSHFGETFEDYDGRRTTLGFIQWYQVKINSIKNKKDEL